MEKINTFHGDCMVVLRKKRNKRFSYGQWKSLSNNAPKDPGSYKIKGTSVSLKEKGVDRKNVGPNQLDLVFKK